jgi:Mn2+/Fe2+ NRAMP family transporter
MTISKKTLTPHQPRPYKYARIAATLILVLLSLSPILAMAGTTSGGTGATNGQEIQPAYDWLHSFLLGYGGKFLALATFGVGMGATILTQKPHGAVIGFFSAMILAYMPGIIESFFSATLVAAL